MQWLTPVIPALREAKVGGSLELLGRLMQENHLNLGGGGYSDLRWCHCTPAWATEQDSISKKQKQSVVLATVSSPKFNAKPTQCEDDEDEDLCDYPLPLKEQPGDPQAEQPHGSPVRLFGPARLLCQRPGAAVLRTKSTGLCALLTGEWSYGKAD
ncbi:hypothetical protein AAY473_017514 [Plecturocebus cupreus]